MALCSDAAMVLYYDIAGDTADHDDWHTYEHMHERLSIPGFVRASRWVAQAGSPRYLVVYEVTGTDMATAPAYLERLNHPTPWTSAMMGRFRGMVRGFCSVVAWAGFGFGQAAVSLRFTPVPGREAELKDWLAREVLPAMASRRGMAGVHLLQPAPPPPMTKEQALRGPDTPMRCHARHDRGPLHAGLHRHRAGGGPQRTPSRAGIRAAPGKRRAPLSAGLRPGSWCTARSASRWAWAGRRASPGRIARRARAGSRPVPGSPPLRRSSTTAASAPCR